MCITSMGTALARQKMLLQKQEQIKTNPSSKITAQILDLQNQQQTFL